MTTDASDTGARRLGVFLSHRYHSPAENQYFWRLLSSVEDVSFRVDEGISFTSTVRLERMIRDAHGFVGIYPLPGGPRETYTRTLLRHEARYFRLELSMAVRARKPAIVFHDHRLVPALKAPSDVRLIEYDAQEIGSATPSSVPTKVTTAYRAFMADLHDATTTATGHAYHKRLVGLIVSPPHQQTLVPALTELLHEHAWEPMTLPWPPRMNLDLITRLRQCDWLVIDLDDPASRMAAAYTHGQFIPTLPITSTTDVPGEDTLYGDVETGHRRALIRWSDPADLERAFDIHLKVTDEPARYIGGADQAVDYFRTAAKRSERVFLSYAAEDDERAAEFSRLLGDRFQHVFDYRASRAIPVGEPWMDTLLTGLARSAVGVLLISDAYLSSTYCLLEARELYRAAVEGRATLVPVRLDGARMPDFLESTQYRNIHRYSPKEIVDELVSTLRKRENAPRRPDTPPS
ncbi:toll/interleukin-1 receptor domain-containing protein [Streptomyces sp. NPDC093546]|uniref:toll/interleukin-1 receptor domain-containing protein n=1 Tax=Streptomyces sp. NPDC093546 TaxID=3366040 RepID=UPI00381C8356